MKKEEAFSDLACADQILHGGARVISVYRRGDRVVRSRAGADLGRRLAQRIGVNG